MSSLLVFNRFYRLEIQSFMLVFSTPIVNQRPSNLLTGSPTSLPPPCPPPCIHTMCNGGGGGGGRIWGLRLISTKYLYWSIFKQSRLLGFGVFIDIWSICYSMHRGVAAAYTAILLRTMLSKVTL
jgi:hypothetical protein